MGYQFRSDIQNNRWFEVSEMKIQLATLALFGALCQLANSAAVYPQHVAAIIDSQDDGDQQPSASGWHDSQAAGSKYFQYIHVPAKDHYEFGHKRGNEHHFIERHEKAHPHAGEFKTKVRWGDKHGGYGEHYWDFNHAGHGDDDGHHHGESQNQEQYVAYVDPKQAFASTKTAHYLPAPRGKREQASDLNDDVEFINDRARSLIVSGAFGKHGGNYRKLPEHERGKREHQQFKDLVLDADSGLFVDEKTGVAYQLQPVEKV